MRCKICNSTTSNNSSCMEDRYNRTKTQCNKWNINNSFSYQTSLNIKETIIDTFVRIRLKEGFRCLFQNSKMAVFSIQLTMFDSGGFGSSQQVGSATASDTATGLDMVPPSTMHGGRAGGRASRRTPHTSTAPQASRAATPHNNQQVGHRTQPAHGCV